jgi:hypothetical protein
VPAGAPSSWSTLLDDRLLGLHTITNGLEQPSWLPVSQRFVRG